MDKLKGKLTIGRRGIIGEDYISIELEDSNSTYDMSLFNLAYQYRELFMAAEKRRVNRINDLLEEHYESGSADRILTKHEKKLILK